MGGYIHDEEKEEKPIEDLGGGLRVSSDFAKAVDIGADALATASEDMVAAACQQYRLYQYSPRMIGAEHAAYRMRGWN